MSDSYEFLKAHFDRIQADQIAARVELLEAARAAAVFLDSVEWHDNTSETDAADIRQRLETVIAEIEDKPTRESAIPLNAEAGAVDQATSVGAQTSSSTAAALSPAEGRHQQQDEENDDLSRSPSDGGASATGSPRKP